MNLLFFSVNFTKRLTIPFACIYNNYIKGSSDPKEEIMKEVWTKSWKKVLIWACGFVSIIAFAIAGGYAIVKGEDDVKSTAKRCFVVTLIFLAADAFMSILSGIAGFASSSVFYDIIRLLNFILLIAKIGIYAAAIIITLVSGRSASQPAAQVAERKDETTAQTEEGEKPEQ